MKTSKREREKEYFKGTWNCFVSRNRHKRIKEERTGYSHYDSIISHSSFFSFGTKQEMENAV